MDGISSQSQSQKANRDHYHSYTGMIDSRRSKKDRKDSDQYQLLLIQEGQGRKVDGMPGQSHSPESTAITTHIPKALFRAKLPQMPLSGQKSRRSWTRDARSTVKNRRGQEIDCKIPEQMQGIIIHVHWCKH